MPGCHILIRIVLTVVIAAQAMITVTTARGTLQQGFYFDTLELHVSPIYNFALTWNPDWWDLEAEESSNGIDRLRFRGASGTVRLDAFGAFDGDPEACLADAETKLAERDGIIRYGPAEFETGHPIEGRGNTFVSRTYMLARQASDGSERYTASTITCWTLVQGEAILRATHDVPAEQYDSVVYDAELLVNAISLPRSAYADLPPLNADDLFPPCAPVPSRPALLFDRSGTEAGAIAFVARQGGGLPHEEYLFSFENTGASSLTVNAQGIYAQRREGTDERSSATIKWMTGASDSSSPTRELSPGERAVVGIEFDPTLGPAAIDFVGMYQANDRQSVYVTPMGSGGCAGLRPRIRVGV